MTDKQNDAPLLPCPFCKATPQPCGHYYEIFHVTPCFFVDEGRDASPRSIIVKRQIPAWNTRADKVTAAMNELAVCDCHTWPTISEMHDYVVALEKKLEGHGSCVTYEQLNLAIDKHRSEAVTAAIAEERAKVWDEAKDVIHGFLSPYAIPNTSITNVPKLINRLMAALEAAKAGKK